MGDSCQKTWGPSFKKKHLDFHMHSCGRQGLAVFLLQVSSQNEAEDLEIHCFTTTHARLPSEYFYITQGALASTFEDL